VKHVKDVLHEMYEDWDIDKQAKTILDIGCGKGDAMLFLNKDKIGDLTKLELPEGKKAAMWRDLFLFSIYAGGLRFSDVIEMQYQHYNKEEHKISKLFQTSTACLNCASKNSSSGPSTIARSFLNVLPLSAFAKSLPTDCLTPTFLANAGL